MSINDDGHTSDRSSDRRLATYGTLAPGRVNHHQLAGLKGTWSTGTVTGRLVQSGWGAELGYPALVLDPMGEPIAVFVFESQELPGHWNRLDDFEGEGYRRTIARVTTSDGEKDASIYVAAEPRSRDDVDRGLR